MANIRVYGLDVLFDDLIDNDDFQILIIGEARGWTATISKRTWSNDLQRYEYKEIVGCIHPDFFGIYDFIKANALYRQKGNDGTNSA